MKYLIYCKSRNMWWKPYKMGYTANIFEAGKYFSTEIQEISDIFENTPNTRVIVSEDVINEKISSWITQQ